MNYDARCAACWLGHAHDMDKHMESIALHETWGSKPGPWTHPDSAENVRARQEWIAAHLASCEYCDGEGRVPNWHGTGDAAGGWADTCDACRGTGKAPDDPHAERLARLRAAVRDAEEVLR